MLPDGQRPYRRSCWLGEGLLVVYVLLEVFVDRVAEAIPEEFLKFLGGRRTELELFEVSAEALLFGPNHHPTH